VGLAGGRRDGLLRIDGPSIAGGRVQVTVASGRVELGQAAGSRLRVRWTLPALLPEAWPAALRPRVVRGPQVRSDEEGLRIVVRRARLRIDLPAGLQVQVRLGRGDITSWGAGGELSLSSRKGRVSCRELHAAAVVVVARDANLHFAQPPRRVDVDAPHILIALPGGPYTVTAPPGTPIEVAQFPGSGHEITVRGGEARILAATAPIRLDIENDGETPEDG
jgi:hypothetical protein